MSTAAQRLGSVVVSRLRTAEGARWLTVGTLVTVEPLTVNVDGTAVAVQMMTGETPGEIGDQVLVGVLRGMPAVSYVVFGKITVVPV